MWAIYNREIQSYFSSLIAYITIGVFLVANGLFLWVFPDNMLDYGFAEMDLFFSNAPYIFMFLIPAVCMRTFSEEYKTGTIELLFTKPITEMQIILAKYIAACTLVLVAIIPTLVYVAATWQLGSPRGNLDVAGITGSYLGLCLLAFLFTALGIWASSMVDNQVTAFITALLMCYLFYNGFAYIASLNTFGSYTSLVEQLGIAYHYNALSKGLIDTKNLVYFASVVGLSLFATRISLLEGRG